MLCSFCIFGNAKIKNYVYPYCSRIHVSAKESHNILSLMSRLPRPSLSEKAFCNKLYYLPMMHRITSAKWGLTVSSRIFFDTAPYSAWATYCSVCNPGKSAGLLRRTRGSDSCVDSDRVRALGGPNLNFTRALMDSSASSTRPFKLYVQYFLLKA